MTSKRHSGQCFIGIESIPDGLNQYRLGSMFLENFYTVLDYDNKEIVFASSKTSEIRTKSESEEEDKNSTTAPFDMSILDILPGNKYSH